MRFFKADLHLHSVLSPCGGLEMSPFAVMKKAKEMGIEIIAITDHNSMANSCVYHQAAIEFGIHYIYGAEIQTSEEEDNSTPSLTFTPKPHVEEPEPEIEIVKPIEKKREPPIEDKETDALYAEFSSFLEDKIDMKEEAWDAQMSEYKRMLRDVYGVDLVRRSRVIPVNVQYAYKKEGKKHIMTDRIFLCF